MAEETFDFEQEVFTLTDEEGNESDFELIGNMEIDGVKYVALLPVEGDIIISTPDSKVQVMVIPTNEELAIARETLALV